MKAKKLLLVAHCVMNQNAVVEGMARARGAFPIAELLITEGIGIIQLPCPELIYGGINRPPLEFGDYNTKEYRQLCRELLLPYVMQIKNYLLNGYTFLGIIAIAGSPTCAITGRRGVLMEELFTLFEQEYIHAPFTEIPESYQEGTAFTELEEKIYRLIRR